MPARVDLLRWLLDQVAGGNRVLVEPLLALLHVLVAEQVNPWLARNAGYQIEGVSLLESPNGEIRLEIRSRRA